MRIKKLIPKKILLLLRKFMYLYDIMKYFFIKSKVNKMLEKKCIKFLTNENLIELIVKDKISLSRYGDGEFGIMLSDQENIYFQKASNTLKIRLLEVFHSNNEKLIVGIPGIFNRKKLKKYKFSSRVYWYKFLNKKFMEISNLIDSNKIYADSLITRCYIDLNKKDKSNNNFAILKEIWDNKDIVIIEGSKTKMGIGNDLFDNANKIQRIICPARNAFESYNLIFDVAKKYCKNKIAIVALGPTASILAYDLCSLNSDEIVYQSIDLGHLDIEYEWYLNNCNKKTAIKGKFVNEVRNVDLSNLNFDEQEEKKYESQIIFRIE